MVKGITRQVVVVQGGDPAMFDQAIFLVRDDLVSQGGVTEEALLEEARRACSPKLSLWARVRSRLLWAGCGAGATGLLWLAAALL